MNHFVPLEIARHAVAIHRLAAGHDGKLVLAVFGEGRAPEIHHFKIGDTVGMTNAALTYATVQRANVYAPLAVMRADLPEGAKGGEDDVIAVLGCVVDIDSDKLAKEVPRSPVAPDLRIETSPNNFQDFIFFDKALAPSEAKPVLRALKRATRADGADDLSHVWRIPGTFNWPNAAKLKRGRSTEPFLVRVKKTWEGTRTEVERLRTALEPYAEEPRIEASNTTAAAGEMDRSDVASLIAFLTKQDEFVDYDPWLRVGMALKISCGDAGFKIWQSTFNGTVTDTVADSKWKSFATEAKPGCTTILSLIARARELGWRGGVRKCTEVMFGNVTATGVPIIARSTTAGMPMLAGQAELARIGAPILEDFLRNTTERSSPRTADCPTLPESMSAHGLYTSLGAVIPRIIALTENGPKLFKHDRESVIEPLAVLRLVHVDTFDILRRRIQSFGCELPDHRVKHAAAAITERVERAFVSGDWIYSIKGEIESDNPDNLPVFLGIIGCELRWNAWRERMEIRGGNDPEIRWQDWTYIDDTIVAKLRTRAMRTKTRFRVAKEFLWEALLALAHKNPVDPVLNRITELELSWDKVPRLDTWLHTTCGVPNDPYHRAVGRNIIGGMVRRARKPGCKHDTMAVLFGPQGNLKSTLAKTIALNVEWFSDSIQLGDASKELVLSLAGKLVVEISEMSARNSANANGIKAMVSRDVDAGRTAYARAVTERARRNIFVGTTNDDEPLSDPTGNRRFLPVRCAREIDLGWLAANIGQLVGEAAALESTGEDFAIPRDVWAIAAEHAEAARSAPDIEIRLTDWLAETPHSRVAYIVASDLSELCEMANLRGGNALRSAVMKRLGFRREKPYFDCRQTWVWFRGPDVLPKTIERDAARYMIGRDGNNRPRVAIRTNTEAAICPPLVALPPMPLRSA